MLSPQPSDILELKMSWLGKLVLALSFSLSLFFVNIPIIVGVARSRPGFNLTNICIVSVWCLLISGVIALGAWGRWKEAHAVLRADETGILVHTLTEHISLNWDEIYALTYSSNWLELRGKNDEVLARWNTRWLTDYKTFPLIEKRIETYLQNTERLEDSRYGALQRWQRNHAFNRQPTLEISINYIWIGVAGIVFFGAMSYESWKAPKVGDPGGIIFLSFALLCVFLLVGGTTLQVSSEGITRRVFFKQRHLSWQEITHIKMVREGRYLLFEGPNKLLSVSGPYHWPRSKSQEMLDYLAALCEQHNIHFERNAQIKNGIIRDK